MVKGEFWTRQKNQCTGGKIAVKVQGNIDRKRGIGYYKQTFDIWGDEWYAIDLKSGISAASASYFKTVQQQLDETWDKVVEFRARDDYAKLCAAFADDIAEAEKERNEFDVK
jgi:hypothetical protein